MGASADAIGIPDQPGSDRAVGAERTAGGGFGPPRLRLRAGALAERYALPTRIACPSRMTATEPPARTLLARKRRGCPALRTRPEPIPRYAPRWPHTGCRRHGVRRGGAVGSDGTPWRAIQSKSSELARGERTSSRIRECRSGFGTASGLGKAEDRDRGESVRESARGSAEFRS